jgi:hypothetical protein
VTISEDIAVRKMGCSDAFGKLAVSPESVLEIERRFGRDKTQSILKEYNIAGTLEALTQGQAKQLLKFSSLNSLRNRIAKEGYPRSLSSGRQTPERFRVGPTPKGPIAQAREANPEALEELRKDVYEWLKDVLPKSALKRIAVELTPYISREGKNARLSEKQWSEIQKQPGEIMGPATVSG